MKKIEIPDYLSHLKVDSRGYPIPFFTPMVNGEPDFLYADGKKADLCLKHHLCWVCGKRLFKGVPVYFITGPQGLKNRAVSDLAMHRRCARYSIRTCPHMFYEKSTRRTGEEDVVSEKDRIAMIAEKPKEWYLIKSDKYKAITLSDGSKIIRFRVLRAIKHWYEGGVITSEAAIEED